MKEIPVEVANIHYIFVGHGGLSEPSSGNPKSPEFYFNTGDADSAGNRILAVIDEGNTSTKKDVSFLSCHVGRLDPSDSTFSGDVMGFSPADGCQRVEDVSSFFGLLAVTTFRNGIRSFPKTAREMYEQYLEFMNTSIPQYRPKPGWAPFWVDYARGDQRIIEGSKIMGFADSPIFEEHRRYLRERGDMLNDGTITKLIELVPSSVCSELDLVMDWR